MFLKKAKMISAIIMSTSLLAMPMIAKADLYTSNNTTEPSTSRINSGFCSTILGAAGITQPGEQNHRVSQSDIDKACMFNKTTCTAEVFMTANCTGPVISTVIFNTKTGIVSTQNSSAAYELVGAPNSFSITINKK